MYIDLSFHETFTEEQQPHETDKGEPPFCELRIKLFNSIREGASLLCQNKASRASPCATYKLQGGLEAHLPFRSTTKGSEASPARKRNTWTVTGRARLKPRGLVDLLPTHGLVRDAFVAQDVNLALQPRVCHEIRELMLSTGRPRW